MKELLLVCIGNFLKGGARYLRGTINGCKRKGRRSRQLGSMVRKNAATKRHHGDGSGCRQEGDGGEKQHQSVGLGDSGYGIGT